MSPTWTEWRLTRDGWRVGQQSLGPRVDLLGDEVQTVVWFEKPSGRDPGVVGWHGEPKNLADEEAIATLRARWGDPPSRLD